MRRLWGLIGALSTGHWLLTVGVPFVAVVLAGASALSWPWLVVLAVGVFLAVLGGLLAFYDVSTPWVRLRRLERTTFAIPREDEMIDNVVGVRHTVVRQFSMMAAEVGVANNPVFHREACRLNDATIWLSYFAPSDLESPLLEVPGSWGREPRDFQPRITLPPNNEVFHFAVAFKHEGEANWYAASAALWRHRDVRLPSHELPAAFIVRVALRGTGMRRDEAWILEVRETEDPSELPIRIAG